MKDWRKIHSPTKQKFLMLLKNGLEISGTRSARKHFRLIDSIPREWRQIERRYLYSLVREFHDDRLVDWRENKDGTISVVLTETGREIANRFDPDKMVILRPSRWDGRWRLVIYDISHKKKVARDALRHKLRELGFKEWQKSVFIFPYPCREQIDFVVEFFELRPYVRYAELINPTNEAELKLDFNLF